MQFVLNPSMIGAFYEKLCERSFIYHALFKRKQNNSNSVIDSKINTPNENNSNSRNESEMNAGIFAGNEWEKKIFDELQMNQKSCYVWAKEGAEEGEIWDKKFSKEDTVEILRNLTDNEKTKKDSKETFFDKSKKGYIYQAGIVATESFCHDYLAKVNKYAKVSFSKIMYPDFIEICFDEETQKYKLTIIDVKSSQFLKENAEIQIALYVMILKYFLQENNIEGCYVNEQTAIVYNKSNIGNKIERIFSLSEALEELNNFFKNKLPNMLQGIKKIGDIKCNTTYTMQESCKMCPLWNHCVENGRKYSSAKLLPYITRDAQKKLDERNILSRKDVFEKLESIRNSDGSDFTNEQNDITDGCPYWKKVSYDLSPYHNALKSMEKGEIKRFAKNVSSYGMVKEKDDAIYISVDTDLLSGRISAYGLYMESFNKNHEKTKNLSKTLRVSENKEEEFNRVTLEFISILSGLLKEIIEKENNSFQIYLFHAFEKRSLSNEIFYILKNHIYRSDAEKENTLEIFYLLADETQAVETGYYPDYSSVMEKSKILVCVILEEIKKLYVLSFPVFYDIAGIAKAFDIQTFEKQDKIEDKLLTESKIVQKIMEDSESNQEDDEKAIMLCDNKVSDYRGAKYFDKGVLSSLYFMNMYEELLNYSRIRNARMLVIEEAIQEGKLLHLKKCKENNKFEILNYDSFHGQLWYSAGLVLKDEEGAGVRAMRSMSNLDKIQVDGIYKLEELNSVPVESRYENQYHYYFNFSDYITDDLAEGEYLLFELYNNRNDKKTEEGLNRLKNRRDFIDLLQMSLETPKEKRLYWEETIRNDYKENESILLSNYSNINGKNFIGSQKTAFQHLFENRLTVLVGPPASGKTDFIARSVISLTNYYREKEKKNLKILISAMSHSAIDNVLQKIAEMRKEQQILTHFKEEQSYDKNTFSIFKAERFEDENLKDMGVELLDGDDHFDIDAEKNPCVIGMTGWAVYNFFYANKDKLPEFDLIIIDEASQVRAVDAFLQLQCSGRDTRFLIVGDDNQLPPIIGGDYPALKEGQVFFFDSVFTMFKSAFANREGKCIVGLTENFRMNEILCRYSANKIYGKAYRANEKNKRNKLVWVKEHAKLKIEEKLKIKESRGYIYLAESILDPAYPLVFCKLSGDSTKQKKAEIRLICAIVMLLWEKTHQMDAIPGAEKDEFWKKICGIISPYHEQINRIRRDLAEALYGYDKADKASDIFIGTVDKLQGKEREAVIVSYGVSDETKIMTDRDFIFSRNRFNVSLTRGKSKTIVILSDQMVSPNLKINVLSHKKEKLREGIEFIHDFAKYVTKESEDEVVRSYYKILKDNGEEADYREQEENKEERQFRSQEKEIRFDIVKKKIGKKDIKPHAFLYGNIENIQKYAESFHLYFDNMGQRNQKEYHYSGDFLRIYSDNKEDSYIKVGIIIDELLNAERNQPWIMDTLRNVNKVNILILAYGESSEGDYCLDWKKNLWDKFGIMAADVRDKQVRVSTNVNVWICDTWTGHLIAINDMEEFYDLVVWDAMKPEGKKDISDQNREMQERIIHEILKRTNKFIKLIDDSYQNKENPDKHIGKKKQGKEKNSYCKSNGIAEVNNWLEMNPIDIFYYDTEAKKYRLDFTKARDCKKWKEKFVDLVIEKKLFYYLQDMENPYGERGTADMYYDQGEFSPKNQAGSVKVIQELIQKLMQK